MIFILIPSYNDSGNFKMLLKNISQTLGEIEFKVIIVDDGSTDQTKEVIKGLTKKFPVERIGYKKNRGPGYAFKQGFKYIIPKISSKDSVVTMEADNSADYSILKKMTNSLNKYDIVLSSPFAKGGKFIGLDLKRMILSRGAVIFDSIIFRVRGVKTYSSFYRAYKGKILKQAYTKYKSKLITDDGFSAVIELLIKLSGLGASIIEIPATLDWTKRKGKSKMKINKTIKNHLAIYKNFLTGKYGL